jgi:serpin B
VDFAAGDALNLINSWGDRQTAGRIKKIFKQLDSNTKLVLANAVYFKADWAAYFLDVTALPFTKADGTVIQAQTMRRNGAARYAEFGGVTAVELAYAAGDYAMWLMLPPAGGKPEDALTPATIAGLRAGFADAAVEIAVPKWDFETSLNLVKLLPDLGLRSAFGPGADFSGIANGLFLSQAVHTANITVDQWGTEAAAITGMSMTTSAPAPPKVRFIADRPFAFAIVGGKDRVPLFVGRVSDPTL